MSEQLEFFFYGEQDTNAFLKVFCREAVYSTSIILDGIRFKNANTAFQLTLPGVC